MAFAGEAPIQHSSSTLLALIGVGPTRCVAWSRAGPCPSGWARFLTPGALHRGAINAGPAPINLLVFTQAGQHGLMQLRPDTSSVPVEQAPPASHAASLSKGLRKVFPWNNCLQHEQEAIEGSVIADVPPLSKGTEARIRGCSCRHRVVVSRGLRTQLLC